MAITHKFQEHDFKNGFQTRSSILQCVSFSPEVIFIGTFNHGWDWNFSDFYYGRGMYMWPILGNLFLHNRNHLVSQRTINNDEPSQQQLFEICKRGKIAFADIVKGVKQEIPTIENIIQKCIIVNNEYEWCSRIIKGSKVGKYSDTHLDNLGSKNWLDDNVDAILHYINSTPSIKHVYFTYKSGSWLLQKQDEIRNEVRKGVSICSLFTPTGNGFRKNLIAPYNERSWSLTHCWVWNDLAHNIQINRAGYGHLDHTWLVDNGVNPNNF